MGRVLKNKNWDRSSYIVSSKAFWGWRGKENKPNQSGLSRKHLTEACHEALQRLQLDYLDLYFCHRPDKNTPIEEVVWTCTSLYSRERYYTGVRVSGAESRSWKHTGSTAVWFDRAIGGAAAIQFI